MKLAFNKESITELFSQLIKVLEGKDLHEVARRLRALSKDVFEKNTEVGSSPLRIRASGAGTFDVTVNGDGVTVISNESGKKAFFKLKNDIYDPMGFVMNMHRHFDEEFRTEIPPGSSFASQISGLLEQSIQYNGQTMADGITYKPVSDTVRLGSATKGTADNVYKKAGPVVDGLKVRKDVPNQGSIKSSFEDYTILDGIREVPLSDFESPPDTNTSNKELAKQIDASKEINPLIVAIDDDGPYILEGSHRYDAMKIRGAKFIPAMVVIDLDTVKSAWNKYNTVLAAAGSDLAHDADRAINIYFRKPTPEDPDGYISSYITAPKPPGEDFNPGNDLADGEWSKSTINRVKRDIDMWFKQWSVTKKLSKDVGMKKLSWDEYNRTLDAANYGEPLVSGRPWEVTDTDRLTYPAPSKQEEKVLKFVKDHDPGKDAKFISQKDALMISMNNPWSRPESGESGEDDLTFKPTMSEARKALGY